ncbi:MAG: DNA recombination protein RmuC [Flaviflexus sp.]|nr:DNA recombination protein RmuC [Flaviflexus sp.]
MDTVTLLAVVIAAVVGLALGYVLASLRAEARWAGERGRIAAAEARYEEIAREHEQLRIRSREDDNLLRALGPVTEQLRDMSGKVGRLHELQSASSAQVSQQLQHAHVTSQELISATSRLNAALMSTSARGVWGETELLRIVEAAGMLNRVHFEAQASQGSGRPDLVINLPGGGRLAVDAKAPMSDYLRAIDIGADDEESLKRRNELLDANIKALRQHIRELQRRNYPGEFPHSPQFTVLFLPTESMLAEALARDGAILEDAAGRGVVLASPSSLLALLRSVAATWSSSRIAEEAESIMALGKDLSTRLSKVCEHLTQLGTGLTRAVKAYNATVGSIEKRLLVTARDFESLPPISEAPPRLDGADAQPRALLTEFADEEADLESR